MSRLARVAPPGYCYHVTHRGNRRARIFLEPGGREAYCGWLKRYADRHGLWIRAWRLMTNHVPLVDTQWARMLALGASLLVAPYVSAAAGSDDPVRFDPGTETCFRLRSGTNTQYLMLNAEGSYSRINREHMGVIETDRGQWSQAESGEITLTSDARFRYVEHGPLSVYVRDASAVAGLPAVKELLTSFLDRNTSMTFTREEVENIEKYGYKNYLSRVSVKFPEPTIEREQLLELVNELDRYMADPTKNLFRVTPYQYGRLTYLLWKDSEPPHLRDKAGIHNWIDRKSTGECPVMIYCQSDAALCREEYQRPQPFQFYPQLNTSNTVPLQSLP